MLTRATYCTREDVLGVLGQAQTARIVPAVDRAIASATASIDSRCHQYFHPVQAARSFTWPDPSSTAVSWRIWMDANPLLSVTSIVSGGAPVDVGDVFLEPQAYGPPYTCIEINTGTSSSFSSDNTGQRAVVVTGRWGYTDDVETVTTLASAISTTTATTLTVADGAQVGVGNLLLVDTERMIVTGRALVTTATTLSSPLTASAADRTMVVANPLAYGIGEVLTLDAEQVLVTDRLAAALLVERAVNSTVLATHTGSTIYAPRQLQVIRGANGTTAATHLNAASVAVSVVPGPIRSLAVGEAIVEVQQATAGYARTAGSGDNERVIGSGAGLNDLRNQVERGYARKGRMRAV